MASRWHRLLLVLPFVALPIAISSLVARGQSPNGQTPAKEPFATREAVCRKVLTAPRIDGKLDDLAWKEAQTIDRFPSFWSYVDPQSGTRAWLVWDDNALYFAAKMPDVELRSFGTKRNDHLWNGDVFEFFFKPSTEHSRYYEFQVNPKSVILELAFPERGFDLETLKARPPMGFEAVAVAEGAIDAPGERDRSWSVEGRIPWSIFAASGGKPKAGAVWNFALCRYDYGPEGTAPVLMSSAPLTKMSFHRFEDYGRLIFESAKP